MDSNEQRHVSFAPLPRINRTNGARITVINMKKTGRVLAWIVYACCYIFILFRMQSPPRWSTMTQPQQQQQQQQFRPDQQKNDSTLSLHDKNLSRYDDYDDDRGVDRPPLTALLELINDDSSSNNNQSISRGGANTRQQQRVAEFLASLLDFAIVGSPKTSTSFHIQWLASHPEIQASTEEVTALYNGNPAALVQMLYNDLLAGKQYKRGYKSPHDIESPTAVELIARYWPETRLIVGLRHPVLWFQSFYNYRERNGYKMPPAESMAHGCIADSHSVCITGAEFHVHLSNLGKTNHRADLREAILLTSMSSSRNSTGVVSNDHKTKKPQHILLSKSKVFLYTLEQVYDTNETRTEQYRRDLSSFLGLKQDLPPFYELRSQGDGKRKEKVAIFDICSKKEQPANKYDELRRNLMYIARSASVWIRDYFLNCPDVYVSSPDYFNQLLLDWMKDPCDEKK